jgi:hypothetical protein
MLQKNLTYNSSVNEWATQENSVARLNKGETTPTLEVTRQLQWENAILSKFSSKVVPK